MTHAKAPLESSPTTAAQVRFFYAPMNEPITLADSDLTLSQYVWMHLEMAIKMVTADSATSPASVVEKAKAQGLPAEGFEIAFTGVWRTDDIFDTELRKLIRGMIDPMTAGHRVEAGGHEFGFTLTARLATAPRRNKDGTYSIPAAERPPEYEKEPQRNRIDEYPTRPQDNLREALARCLCADLERADVADIERAKAVLAPIREALASYLQHVVRSQRLDPRPTLAEGQATALVLNDFVSGFGFRFRLPGYNAPATLSYLPRGTAKPGAYILQGIVDGATKEAYLKMNTASKILDLSRIELIITPLRRRSAAKPKRRKSAKS